MADKGETPIMKLNRLTTSVLTMLLSLTAISQPAPAQQTASAKRIITNAADGSVNLLLLAGRWRARRFGFRLMPSALYPGTAGKGVTPIVTVASQPAVHGTGTVGKVPLWTDASPSENSILGDSIITQLSGNIGIDVAAPASKLTVQGMIETTMGGYKFPDGTVQTTAAVSGLQSISHDLTLVGNGTASSPLGVAVPLSLHGASDILVDIRNFNDSPNSLGLRVIGNGTAVRALSTGAGGTGVKGLGGSDDDTSNGGGTGVSGFGGLGSISDPGGIGVLAQGGDSSGFGGNGVVATGGDLDGRGVFATGGIGSVGYGVEAKGGASLGAGHVAGAGIKTTGGASSGSNSASGTGILAIAGEATNGATRGRAGIFEGDVSVSGHLNAGSLDVTGTKNFKIDHPLDPENKYLLHAAIESFEVLNIYSGNVVTNARGEAVVTLPSWFDALNRDLRYQLTVIGTFAQAIVGTKVNRNRFTIRTNAPNVEVSWQVTGVRSDAVMRKNPFKAEENKPEHERGSFSPRNPSGSPRSLARTGRAIPR